MSRRASDLARRTTYPCRPHPAKNFVRASEYECAKYSLTAMYSRSLFSSSDVLITVSEGNKMSNGAFTRSRVADKARRILREDTQDTAL